MIKAPIPITANGTEILMPTFAPVVRSDDEEENADALEIAIPV
jgi:hypothetical protein